MYSTLFERQLNKTTLQTIREATKKKYFQQATLLTKRAKPLSGESQRKEKGEEKKRTTSGNQCSLKEEYKEHFFQSTA
ncbi:MAG: hypothetical protein D3910_20445 [Candidatus Electrothrix sp. ATG2]|nr:hypothetical protein [Candidatus Electrothrix sp. ATG2]